MKTLISIITLSLGLLCFAESRTVGELHDTNTVVTAESDPTVPDWAKAENPPQGMPTTGLVWSVTAGKVKTADGAKTIGAADVGALPSSYTPPAAPVQSVNNKTGAVQLGAADVGAYAKSTETEIGGGYIGINASESPNRPKIGIWNGDPDFGNPLVALDYDVLMFWNGDTWTEYSGSSIRRGDSNGFDYWILPVGRSGTLAVESWQALVAMLDDATVPDLATNATFSSAVLAVQIDTNTVAQIGELKEFFDGLPVGTVGTSLGGIILALLSAVAWLKKNKVQTLKLNDGSIVKTAENGVAKLDDFFKESNGFTPPTTVAGALQNSLLEKSIVLAVTENFADADTTAYGGQN